jgi:hypothetical protein
MPDEHRIQDMRISCPPGWSDRSMLVLSADVPGPSGVAPNLVVMRDVMVPEVGGRAPDLRRYVDRQLDSMQSLADFVLEMRRSEDNNSLVETHVTWRSEGIPIRQWITYAGIGGDALIVATATAGVDDFSAAEPGFRAMLQTLQTL